MQDVTLSGPVIAIGPDGTNRATARPWGIARAPKGAVVLPGLNLDLDDRTWAMMRATRPKYRGVVHHPRRALPSPRPSPVKREVVVSPRGAHRLAARDGCIRATSGGIDRRVVHYRGVDANELDAALQGVSLIEAADERGKPRRLRSPCGTF